VEVSKAPFGALLIVVVRPLSARDSIATFIEPENQMNAEARLLELGISLPEYPTTVGKYVQAVLVGHMLHIAGHGPARVEGIPVIGKIGGELTLEQGIVAARQVGLNTLAIMKHHLGTLDRVVRFVKMIGRVHAVPDFRQHAEIVDGYTDLMISVFGDAALCARAAPGMGSAPFKFAMIADALVQVR
jgi:enamine deaminase RidA (YjgF/YER057c/UK114 family)